jgi:hypothetical protein
MKFIVNNKLLPTDEFVTQPLTEMSNGNIKINNVSGE